MYKTICTKNKYTDDDIINISLTKKTKIKTKEIKTDIIEEVNIDKNIKKADIVNNTEKKPKKKFNPFFFKKKKGITINY